MLYLFGEMLLARLGDEAFDECSRGFAVGDRVFVIALGALAANSFTELSLCIGQWSIGNGNGIRILFQARRRPVRVAIRAS
jgi:hypothetical protein